jgi:hypothetical protein
MAILKVTDGIIDSPDPSGCHISKFNPFLPYDKASTSVKRIAIFQSHKVSDYLGIEISLATAHQKKYCYRTQHRILPAPG